jgi:hypothetical protein
MQAHASAVFRWVHVGEGEHDDGVEGVDGDDRAAGVGAETAAGAATGTGQGGQVVEVVVVNKDANSNAPTQIFDIDSNTMDGNLLPGCWPNPRR